MRRALLVAAFALLLAPAAQAGPASSAQVRALAWQTAHDPSALATLRGIDSVDGQAMPLARVLAVQGATLAARLHALAQPGVPTPAPQARGEARQILAGRRYTGSPVPRPLHRPLAWLGEKLAWPVHRAGDAVARLLRWLGLGSPGGTNTGWAILAGILLAGILWFVVRVSRRSGGQAILRADDLHGSRGDDPAKLEQAAEEAERQGELERALRLRFRAGLLRLARARAIPPRASLTTGQARRLLDSRDFDELALTFEEVVYGGRSARIEDLDRARSSWPAVLAGARTR